MMQRIQLRALISSLLMVFPLFAQAGILPESSPKQQYQQPSLSPMLHKVMPAVVNLSVRGELHHLENPYSVKPGQNEQQMLPPELQGTQPKFQHVGSGVIVDADKGYILTNAHVIKDAQIITVTLGDGRHLIGKTIGSDEASDLAVLQVHANKLTSIPFANSDKADIGDFVTAVGNPFGLHQTVTSGIISATNRQIGVEGYENFIQTDAPINMGNSGGALVNMDGELIGINTAILSTAGGSVGIGFAIPSNMAQGVMAQLIEYGKVQRGLLGVMVQDLTPSLADAFHVTGAKGALVTRIDPGSAAEEAGLKSADIIESINDKAVHNAAQLRSMIGVLRVGSKVALKIRRAKSEKTLYARIKDPEKHQFEQIMKQSMLAGLHMRTYDQLDTHTQPIRGVQVLEVNDRSLAWFSGVRPGDVILSANNKTTPRVSELLDIAKTNPDRLLLKIRRLDGIIFIVMDK